MGESCVTASGGRKRRALGGHASSLLISGQEDASSKWRASHSAVVELSTSQRRVKRWILADLAHPMSIGPMRTRTRRHPGAGAGAGCTLEALPTAAVRVCVQVQTRDLRAAAVSAIGARRSLRCACACLRTPQRPSRSSTAMARRGKVCVWHRRDVAVRYVGLCQDLLQATSRAVCLSHKHGCSSGRGGL